MRLWLIERTDDVDWDEYSGGVVRAETEEEARGIARREFADYRELSWQDDAVVTCTPLDHDGEPGVILADFKAG